MTTLPVPCQTDSRLSGVLAEEFLTRDGAATTGAGDSTAGLVAAILGLRLRGVLIDSDCENLDQLGGPNDLIFLLQGTDWLHPADLPLFDYELIETAVSICGEAVVSHRYQPLGDDPKTWYTVTTAVLNPGEETPLVLGLIGPDVGHEQEIRRDRFISTVSAARSALNEIARVEDFMREKFLTDEPMTMVDQTGGTILYANPAAHDAALQEGEQIDGMPFAELADRIGIFTRGRRVSIRHLSVGPLCLSMMGVPADAVSLDETDSVEELTQELNGALKELCRTISDLKAHVGAVPSGLMTSLLEQIDAQSHQVRQGIEHLGKLAAASLAFTERDKS